MFNKTIAAATIRFIVTVAIFVFIIASPKSHPYQLLVFIRAYHENPQQSCLTSTEVNAHFESVNVLTSVEVSTRIGRSKTTSLKDEYNSI